MFLGYGWVRRTGRGLTRIGGRMGKFCGLLLFERRLLWLVGRFRRLWVGFGYGLLAMKEAEGVWIEAFGKRASLEMVDRELEIR